jgi:hypothetical protein
MARRTVSINRAPVLTLWAAIVAQRLGFNRAEALTLGKAVAGMNAYAKGVRLGIYEPSPQSVKEQREKMKHGEHLHVALLNRAVPVARTPEALRALAKEKPVDPKSVGKYLESKFGDALGDVAGAMTKLAASMPPQDLAAKAYKLYEEFRPEIPEGVRGWGAAGLLDLELIEDLAP